MPGPLRSWASTNEYNALKTCSESSPFLTKNLFLPQFGLFLCPLAPLKLLTDSFSSCNRSDEHPLTRTYRRFHWAPLPRLHLFRPFRSWPPLFRCHAYPFLDYTPPNQRP